MLRQIAVQLMSLASAQQQAGAVMPCWQQLLLTIWQHWLLGVLACVAHGVFRVGPVGPAHCGSCAQLLGHHLACVLWQQGRPWSGWLVNSQGALWQRDEQRGWGIRMTRRCIKGWCIKVYLIVCCRGCNGGCGAVAQHAPPSVRLPWFWPSSSNILRLI
jgi:hypothetical protein